MSMVPKWFGFSLPQYKTDPDQSTDLFTKDVISKLPKVHIDFVQFFSNQKYDQNQWISFLNGDSTIYSDTFEDTRENKKKLAYFIIKLLSHISNQGIKLRKYFQIQK